MPRKRQPAPAPEPVVEPVDEAPYGYDGYGKVVVRDPLLHPDSQQPGESVEHYVARQVARAIG